MLKNIGVLFTILIIGFTIVYIVLDILNGKQQIERNTVEQDLSQIIEFANEYMRDYTNTKIERFLNYYLQSDNMQVEHWDLFILKEKTETRYLIRAIKEKDGTFKILEIIENMEKW